MWCVKNIIFGGVDYLRRSLGRQVCLRFGRFVWVGYLHRRLLSDEEIGEETAAGSAEAITPTAKPQSRKSKACRGLDSSEGSYHKVVGALMRAGKKVAHVQRGSERASLEHDELRDRFRRTRAVRQGEVVVHGRSEEGKKLRSFELLPEAQLRFAFPKAWLSWV